MKQKDIFLQSEGDAWFERNHVAAETRDFSRDDPIALEVCRILRRCNEDSDPSNLRLLEIGSGDGARLKWLNHNLGIDVQGLEPSTKAVEASLAKGVKAIRGTADSLPFDSCSFDIVIFGFCLYLCDVDDLFQIAGEAHRVLRDDAWVVIHDFHASSSRRRAYHHRPGLYSHKMSYNQLFDWHPDYTCVSHVVRHHLTHEYTDDPEEWVATVVLRKHSQPYD